MQPQINLTLIANTGILIEYEGSKLLVDGIFGPEGHSFSNIEAETWMQMKKGQGIFEAVDYLLFTHDHPDHFSPSMALEYLKHQRPKGIFLPEAQGEDFQELEQYIQKEKIPCVLIEKGSKYKVTYRPEVNLAIKYYDSIHLDEKFYEVAHFCFLISLGGRNLLFTADIDFFRPQLLELKDEKIDIVFVNPLLYHGKKGQEFLREIIQPETIIVYHVPFAQDDQFKIRKMLQKDLQLYPDMETIILEEPLQSILT